MHKTDLKSLSDDELLLRVSKLLSQSRRVESVLVAHLAEVDVRRLYVIQALPSIHKYCTEVLHLSEAEAYLRIEAARMSRRHPVVLKMLEKDYGKKKVDRYRRSGDCVREPAPAFELRPDGAPYPHPRLH